MLLFWECLIGVVLFTLIVVPMTLRDPIASIGDYPPAIRERCEELGLIAHREKRFSKADMVRKVIGAVVLVVLFALLLRHVNGITAFLPAFLMAYTIWLVIAWYDALVLDCLWFCHSKRVRIPGTEDMKEYKDYGFHIRQSCIGTLLGLPACLAAALVVTLL